jgi:transcriptional regulator with XRE-family HTH domain
MVAAGAYIRTLREKRKFTREAVAKLADTSVSQLVRIEAGEQDTRSSLLIRIVTVLQGKVEHIAELLAADSATADDGRALAERAVQVIDEAGARPYLKTPEDVADLLRLFEDELATLQEDERRSLGDQLRGFLAGFRASRRRTVD